VRITMLPPVDVVYQAFTDGEFQHGTTVVLVLGARHTHA
jgi:hypothetical protein